MLARPPRIMWVVCVMWWETTGPKEWKLLITHTHTRLHAAVGEKWGSGGDSGYHVHHFPTMSSSSSWSWGRNWKWCGKGGIQIQQFSPREVNTTYNRSSVLGPDLYRTRDIKTTKNAGHDTRRRAGRLHGEICNTHSHAHASRVAKWKRHVSGFFFSPSHSFPLWSGGHTGKGLNLCCTCFLLACLLLLQT